MKNKTPEINQEFEKLIKDKMNELSSSVDCFNKISEKAFPEKKQDFSEIGFAVCDLENITGKSKKPLFLKWIAVAVAFVICIIVFPETSVFDNLMASLGKSPEKIYSDIIEEIFKETSENTYKIYDMPIDDYIKYDTLITPFYSCPFKECGKNNINVRIFVRTYNNIPTNQIYAVEYTGEYEKSNFIAVADTKAKFTDDELENIVISETKSENSVVSSAIRKNFTPAVTEESVIRDNENYNIISLASFEYNNIFKSDDDEIQVYLSQVLYYANGNDDIPEIYYYDIYNAPDLKNEWKNSVCFDGFSAIPEKNKSLFVHKELFNSSESINDTLLYGYVTLSKIFTENNNNSLSDNIDFYTLELNTIYDGTVTENISTLAVPYDNEILKTLKMYFSQSGMIFSSASNPVITIISKNKNITNNVFNDDENYYIMYPDLSQTESDKLTEEEAINNIVDGYDYRF